MAFLLKDKVLKKKGNIPDITTQPLLSAGTALKYRWP